MVELADVFRAAGPRYRAAHAERMLPSHRRAMQDIVACRTPALGGSLYQCDDCGALDYRYHSCRNRHCPKCQEERAQDWLERTRARLLPCEHSFLTFTLPQELRAVARSHQRLVYAALLREAAASLQTLANDRQRSPTIASGSAARSASSRCSIRGRARSSTIPTPTSSSRREDLPLTAPPGSGRRIRASSYQGTCCPRSFARRCARP